MLGTIRSDVMERLLQYLLQGNFLLVCVLPCGAFLIFTVFLIAANNRQHPVVYRNVGWTRRESDALDFDEEEEESEKDFFEEEDE